MARSASHVENPPREREAELHDGGLRLSSLWLDAFEGALRSRDPDAIEALFIADGWWRDLLATGWDLHTVAMANVSGFVRDIDDRTFDDFHLLATPAPTLVEVGSRTLVEAHFTFQAGPLHCFGIVKLSTELDESFGKAWVLFTVADQLVGHEEAVGLRRPLGVERTSHGAPGTAWVEKREAEQRYEARDPEILIIGAGHSGLGLASRLKRLGVDALIVERNPTVGDNWRRRYRTLVLHDAVWGNHLPYLEFPPSWPVYTPKDLLADWLEAYSRVMELNVWTSTRLGRCDYDDHAARWTVELHLSDGTTRTVRPAHIVFATGTSGTVPDLPSVPGSSTFDGRVLHSSEFEDGAEFAGARAVVVGASTSGHDIAQNLVENGAASVTMIQRSSTYVFDITAAHQDRPVSQDSIPARYSSEGSLPIDVCDRIEESIPYFAQRETLRAGALAQQEADRDLLEGLAAAGFATNRGIDGTGLWGLYVERGGGYYPNVGASNMIVSGAIGVRSGVSVVRFTQRGIVLDDGSEIAADVVVFATGFKLMGDTVRSIIGDAEAARCGPIWGVDDEGELRSMWRPSGHPGLWFTGGNLAWSRFYSKVLALQLAARTFGYVPVVQQ
jgi:putative flavoprotein involved in K+ transport